MSESQKDWELPSFVRTDFSEKKNRWIVLIPVLNEGERIRTQLRRMSQVKGSFDIAIVDGGSTDDALTPDFLRQNQVRALLVKTGTGRLGAQLRIGLAEGLREGYEGIILIDGNNKDNPEAIPRFIDLLENGYDHIQGSRFVRGGIARNTPWLRCVGIKALHAPLLSLAARFRYTDTTNGFRAYSRKFLLDPRVSPFRNVFAGYELHYYLAIRAGQLGFKVKEIPVERVYPKGEKAPTKIKGWRGNLNVLKTLFRCCLGDYDPK